MVSYYAFISYSSKDRLIGQRFHRALERYRIPKPLRGRTTANGVVPSRLTPIFRDRSDLEASSSLAERIEAALSESRALIVLCSPHSAASKWVNKEVATFKKLGRKDKIIGVLVDGEAKEFDQDTSPNGAFCPALLRGIDADGNLTDERSEEPFTPDLREMRTDGTGGDGFEFAKLKVVARLIDVPLSELTQRQNEVERRERRLNQLVASLMLALALVAMTVGWIAWRKNLEAETRLNTAIEIATRQIDSASRYRNQYGVPARVIAQLLNSARDDFAKLVADVGERPQLLLQRVRLSLRFAELYQAAGESKGRKESLILANTDLDYLENRTPGFLERIGLELGLEDLSDVAVQRIRYFTALANDFSVARNSEKALELEAAIRTLAQTWYDDTNKVSWRKEIALSHYLAGSIYYRDGNLKESQRSYEAGIDLFDRLDSGNARPQYRRELRDGLSSLATTALDADERELSLKHQSRALEIAKSLVEEEPQNTDAKRVLIITLTRYGDTVIAVHRDPSAALASYQEALAFEDELTTIDPLRVDWQRDKHIILERIGSAQMQLLKLSLAEEALLSSLSIVERLVKIDTANLTWLRDQTVVQERIAQLRIAQADAAADESLRKEILLKARQTIEGAVKGRELLLKSRPTDKIARHDLALAKLSLANVLSRLGNSNGADLLLFEEAISMLRQLLSEPNASVGWLEEIAMIYGDRAQAFLRLNDKAKALIDLKSALGIVKELLSRFPGTKQYVLDEQKLIESINILSNT